MADISVYLAQILSAVYGEDVRGSIHDAIEIINDVSEVVLSTGTAVTGPTSSSTGFYDESLYLNTDTYELWKCVGTDTWQSLGILKGDDGSPGVPGEDGNRWYRGTGISGKAVNPTVYSGSGIADANPNDFYLNPSEGAVYHCVTGGDASTATWSYDFTMTGGGGGGSVVGWNQIQTSTGATKIAEITIDGSTTDVYAPQGGGGGASSLDDLSDVGIDTQTLDDGQILAYNQTDGEFQNVDMPTGGHTMLPDPTSTPAPDEDDVVNAVNGVLGGVNPGANDDVPSLFGLGTWSNTDTIKLLTTVAQGDDSVGTWEADDTWESGSRAYWLKHESLHGILSDDDVEISLVFDVSGGEAISCLAYRIDDAITSSLGGIAIKFNAPIQSSGGATVGVVLKHNRTKTSVITRTS